MRLPPMLCLSLFAFGITSSAWAAFDGLSSDYQGMIDGRHVWRVYAVSNSADDTLFAAFGHHVFSGTMAAVEHNDSLGGTWAPQSGSAMANDSFVTVTGGLGVGVLGGASGTVLSSGWANGGIGTEIINSSGEYGGASWQVASAAAALRADSGLFVNGTYRVMIMQIAGTNLAPGGNFGFSARINLGWWQGEGATTQYLFNGSYTVPAPGALVLAGVATLHGFGRRRRH